MNPEAEEQELEHRLRRDLRIGPGGLKDEQRRRIFAELAVLPTSSATSTADLRRHGRRSARQSAWISAAAVLLFGLAAFLVARSWQTGPVPMWSDADPARTAAKGSVEILLVSAGDNQPPHNSVPAEPQLSAWNHPFLPTHERPVARVRPGAGTAGFETLRQHLREHAVLPPPGSVAYGEVLNYVQGGSRPPGIERADAMIINAEAGPCPWDPQLRLVHITLATPDDPDNPGDPVAEDLTLAIHFNPARVAGHRLIGQRVETRGDHSPNGARLRSGETATLVYEIMPLDAGLESTRTTADAETTTHEGIEAGPASAWAARGDLLALSAHYTRSRDQREVTRELRLPGWQEDMHATSPEFQLAAAVVWTARLFESRETIPDALAHIQHLVEAAMDHDPDGRRAEFLGLVRLASHLTSRNPLP